MPSMKPMVSVADAERFRELIELGPETNSRIHDVEHRVSQLTATTGAVAVASRNIALHLILRALDLQAGDEVIMPAYASVDFADVIRHFDAHPILVDVEADTLHTDTDEVEAALSDRTRAVVTIDSGGLRMDSVRLDELADRHGFLLISDAGGQCLEIQPSHTNSDRSVRLYTPSSTGESGAVIASSHNALNQTLRGLLDPEDSPLPTIPNGILRYADAMTDSEAAWNLIGLDTSLDRWQRRCEIAMSYTANLSSLFELEVPGEPAESTHSWNDYVLRLNLQHLPVSRDGFLRRLRNHGVSASFNGLPIHMHPYYSEMYSFSPDSFPVTRNAYLREVSLPIHSAVTDEQVDAVSRIVVDVSEELRSPASRAKTM